MSEHTKLPWEAYQTNVRFHDGLQWRISAPEDSDGGSYDICEMYNGEQGGVDARHSVKCVNLHDALVAALREVVRVQGWVTIAHADEQYDDCIKTVRALLKRCEEREPGRHEE